MANHLVAEKSPYLLQHAQNPVDWYAWGPDAFAKAKREDKPIFLSIGYSTCHWCHVMERESFESDEIAALLNEGFVSIKVDREERPDVDRIYMTFVQATRGQGGWPMSVFLTPELKPFFGGTYFPPDNRYGQPGFKTVLQSLARAWRQERDKIDVSSAEVIEQLAAFGEPRASGPSGLDAAVLDSAYQYFRRTFDATYGGFGAAPKFPRPVVLNFLLRYHARTKNEEALDMCLRTLRAMAEGGMNDQLGGGFHRYSVDEEWFLPHFEKMLYDQAQLAISYLEAFQITGDPFFAQAARNTLDYVLRDMSDAAGGFHSAEDADSVVDPAHPHEKAEGAFYVWTRQELDALLGNPDAAVFSYRYGVETNGNVQNDPHGEFPGKNILFAAHSIAETAGRFAMTEAAVVEMLSKAAGILMEQRSRRVRPHRDDKVLTAWNGLMISALAKGARVLKEPRYGQAAARAAGFIAREAYDAASGTLLRRYRDHDVAIPGFLDDYAFFVQALLDLYETLFRVSDIDLAAKLTDRMIKLFEDDRAGAFFSTAAGDASLVLRLKDDYDGAEPSGNAVALQNLLRLAQLTSRPEYHAAVDRTFQGLSGRIAQQAAAVPQMLAALDYHLSPKRQVILAGDPNEPGMRAMIEAVHARFLPNTILICIDSPQTRDHFATGNQAVADMRELQGQATAYVCENFTCQLPVNDVPKLIGLLQ